MPVFQCVYCEYMTNSRTALVSHTYTHTGDKPFKCEFCGKGFTQNSNLKSHLISHNAGDYNKVYQCEQCSFETKWKGSFVIHLRMHTGEKPFKCKKCGQTFSQMTHRATHMREIHGSTRSGQAVVMRSFKCDVCSKAFKRSDHLNRHKLIHTQEKNFKCDDCDKCFYDAYGLRLHERIHQGDASKIYKCDKCSYKSRYKLSLDTHLRTHLKLSINCKICSKSFAHFHLLNLHMNRRHRIKISRNSFINHRETSSLMARCTICIIGFKNRDEVDKHYMEVHGKKFNRVCFSYSKTNSVQAKKMKAAAFMKALEKTGNKRRGLGIFNDSENTKQFRYERRVIEVIKSEHSPEDAYVKIKKLDLSLFKFNKNGTTRVRSGTNRTKHGNNWKGAALRKKKNEQQQQQTNTSSSNIVHRIPLTSIEKEKNPLKIKVTNVQSKNQKNQNDKPGKKKKSNKPQGIICRTQLNPQNILPRYTVEIDNAISGNVMSFDSARYQQAIMPLQEQESNTGLLEDSVIKYELTPGSNNRSAGCALHPWMEEEDKSNIKKDPNDPSNDEGFASLRELVNRYL